MEDFGYRFSSPLDFEDLRLEAFSFAYGASYKYVWEKLHLNLLVSQTSAVITATITRVEGKVGSSKTLWKGFVGLGKEVSDVVPRVDEEYGVSISLADEKALSQKNSPYKTIGVLANYADGLIKEANND